MTPVMSIEGFLVLSIESEIGFMFLIMGSKRAYMYSGNDPMYVIIIIYKCITAFFTLSNYMHGIHGHVVYYRKKALRVPS